MWLKLSARNKTLAYGSRGSRGSRFALRARYQALAFGSLSNELLAGSSWLALARVSGLNLGLNSSLNLGLNPG